MGCRRAAAPSELVRIARRLDGTLVIGPGPGRGAWLCAGSERCFDLAVRRRALARSLRTEIRDDEVGRLRATLYGRPRAEGSPR
ncbi:MAG TPA: YlxR family protein [Acidimicrobiia bacterium]